MCSWCHWLCRTAAYSIATVPPTFCSVKNNLCSLTWNASLAVCQRACECRHTFKNSGILRNTGRFILHDRFNQHCVNSFGQGLNVTYVPLYEKVTATFAQSLVWTKYYFFVFQYKSVIYECPQWENCICTAFDYCLFILFYLLMLKNLFLLMPWVKCANCWNCTFAVNEQFHVGKNCVVS